MGLPSTLRVIAIGIALAGTAIIMFPGDAPSYVLTALWLGLSGLSIGIWVVGDVVHTLRETRYLTALIAERLLEGVRQEGTTSQRAPC